MAWSRATRFLIQELGWGCSNWNLEENVGVLKATWGALKDCKGVRGVCLGCSQKLDRVSLTVVDAGAFYEKVPLPWAAQAVGDLVKEAQKVFGEDFCVAVNVSGRYEAKIIPGIECSVPEGWVKVGREFMWAMVDMCIDLGRAAVGDLIAELTTEDGMLIGTRFGTALAELTLARCENLVGRQCCDVKKPKGYAKRSGMFPDEVAYVRCVDDLYCASDAWCVECLKRVCRDPYVVQFDVADENSEGGKVVWTDVTVESPRPGVLVYGAKECKDGTLAPVYDEGRKRTVPPKMEDGAVPWSRMKSVLYGGFNRLYGKGFGAQENMKVIFGQLAAWLAQGYSLNNVRSVLYAGRKSTSYGVRWGCEQSLFCLSAFCAVASQVPGGIAVFHDAMSGGKGNQWNANKRWNGGGNWQQKNWGQGGWQGNKKDDGLMGLLKENIETNAEVSRAEALSQFRATIEAANHDPQATALAREEAVNKILRDRMQTKMQTAMLGNQNGNGGNQLCQMMMMSGAMGGTLNPMAMMGGALTPMQNLSGNGGLGMTSQTKNAPSSSGDRTPLKTLVSEAVDTAVKKLVFATPHGNVEPPPSWIEQSILPPKRMKKETSEERAAWVEHMVAKAGNIGEVVQRMMEKCEGGSKDSVSKWMDFAISMFNSKEKENVCPSPPPVNVRGKCGKQRTSLGSIGSPMVVTESVAKKEEKISDMETHECLNLITNAKDPLTLLPYFMRKFGDRPAALKVARDNVWSASEAIKATRLEVKVPKDVQDVVDNGVVPEVVAPVRRGGVQARPKAQMKEKGKPKAAPKMQPQPLLDPMHPIFEEEGDAEMEEPMVNDADGGYSHGDRVLHTLATRVGQPAPERDVSDKAYVELYLKRFCLADLKQLGHDINVCTGYMLVPGNKNKRDTVPKIAEAVCDVNFELQVNALHLFPVPMIG